MKKFLMAFIVASTLSPAFALAQQSDESISSDSQQQEESSPDQQLPEVLRPHCRHGDHWEIRWCWDWRHFRFYRCGFHCRGDHHHLENETDNQDNN
ncbi:MAG: hypothetical protein ACXVCY_05920 [Pseudobdellovibrionaceae bacterium]